MTTDNFKDSELVPDLLEKIDGKIDKLSGDGGYDSYEVFP